MKDKGKTVVVAMSGGVDSSIAAYMMKKNNYNVIGITLKTWDYKNLEVEKISCCSTESISRAQKVAEQLGIKHYIFDFSEAFNNTVINNFISEYLAGRTPNPCVICNKYIKWGLLLDKVKSLGADFLVTGHYAGIKKLENNRLTVSLSKDKLKDQSYFLWVLSQEALSKSIFPLGDFTKVEIRKIAKDLNLKSAKIPDSQEICFIPDNDYPKFLISKIGDKISEGDIVYKDKLVGRHKGYPFYTIGQRRGLNLSLGKPVYVRKIDSKNNIIYVDDEKNLYTKEFLVNSINFLSVNTLNSTCEVLVKVRYKDVGTPALIEQIGEDEIKVILKTPKKSVTPGQSAVFYIDDYLLCGGFIV